MNRRDLENAARDGLAGTSYTLDSIQFVSSNLGYICYICPVCGRNRLPVFATGDLAKGELVRRQLAEHDRKHSGI
jgi:hypothetical protein